MSYFQNPYVDDPACEICDEPRSAHRPVLRRATDKTMIAFRIVLILLGVWIAYGLFHVMDEPRPEEEVPMVWPTGVIGEKNANIQ